MASTVHTLSTRQTTHLRLLGRLRPYVPRNHAVDVRPRCQSSQLSAPATRPVSSAKFTSVLVLSGASMGPLLDGIHSRVQLQMYDVLPIHWAGLYSSWAVPPLLASFYLVFGAMNTFADAKVADSATDELYSRLTPAYVALNTGVLAILLQTSASLYESGVDYSTIGCILAALGAVNWKVFDGTKQGLALAFLVAFAAPASELVLNSQLSLWHYSQPDIVGIVSWVPWCYFFYSPALANLARLAWTST